ncbi:hypothetical protein [Streptomyces avicenniae]|uniref:hypothetical protein n=1 Tax=Streptomyces avicenniae TaxID=500153 RepID=UPI000DA62E20
MTAVSRSTTRATVHNLTIEGIHTYYVLAAETPVLVHNCGVTGLSSLRGRSLADAEQDMFGQGFSFTSETGGGYRRYGHSDGSQIWIRPNGEVQRLGPSIDPGPNQKNYR